MSIFKRKPKPTPARLKVFISYSRANKNFARQLESAFLAHGVDTFLDVKDIRVGDSFPEKIYTAIGEATHMVSVLSRAAIQSRWVVDELSAGKVRQLSQADFRILPVLIEDVTLPMPLQHIHYADFRRWENPSCFKESFLQLLRGLGIESVSLGSMELVWCVQNIVELRRLATELNFVDGQLYGGLSSTFQSGRDDSHYLAFKWAVHDQDVLDKLRRLHALAPTHADPGSKTDNLRVRALETLDFARVHFTSRESERDRRLASQFHHLIHATSETLLELLAEMEIVLASSVRSAQPTD